MASAEVVRENRGEEPVGDAQEGDGGEEVKEGGAAEETSGEGEPVEEEEKEAAGGEGKERGGKRNRARKQKDDARDDKIIKKRQAREAKPSPARPTRERKTVERFSEMSPRRTVVTKAVPIQKGSGTQLKDIPNVFFKLSKRKVDDNLRLLHTILFAKKAKALYVKRNMYQFSGFVWSENEEKQRARIKEKLDKCVKTTLLDFCDVLDVPVSRAVAKKEEIAAKLLEFLESPCITRDVVLSEKEQKARKRKRSSKGASGGYAESDRETKKQKEADTSKKGRKHSVEKLADDKGGTVTQDKDASDDDDQDEGGKMEEEHDDDSESEGEENEQDEPTADKEEPPPKRTKGAKSKVNLRTSALKKGSPSKSTKASSSSLSKKSSIEVRGMSSGKSREGSAKEQIKPIPKKSTKQTDETIKSKGGSRSESYESLKEKDKKKSQSGPKVSAREQGKEKSSGKDKEPTREEVHAAVWAILKEVDFNTATLADILKQLGSHFGIDLMHRKAEVRSIIEEVINAMTDDDEDEGEEDNHQ